VFKEARIIRKVTIKDTKTRTGKQVRICDIATSHMARRVFIGSLYQKGIKNEIIASMSGHTQDSKSFNRYYKIDRESQNDAIKMIE
jgi:integrase